jgi:septal ring factor EnvC (AmiA/AmiB activator)
MLHRSAADELDRLRRELADMTSEANAWRANARDSGEEARKYKRELADARKLLRALRGETIDAWDAEMIWKPQIDAFLTPSPSAPPPAPDSAQPR